jgi:hypothetical protein
MPTSLADVSTTDLDTALKVKLHEYPVINFDDLGIEPGDPTEAKPGSEEKVVMLAARYNAGLPLWHNEDCVDHGPGGTVDEED